MIFGATCKRTKHRTKPRSVYRWKVRAIADSARVTGQAGSKTDRPDSRHYFRFVLARSGTHWSDEAYLSLATSPFYEERQRFHRELLIRPN
jgi:hypothetical protein